LLGLLGWFACFGCRINGGDRSEAEHQQQDDSSHPHTDSLDLSLGSPLYNYRSGFPGTKSAGPKAQIVRCRKTVDRRGKPAMSSWAKLNEGERTMVMAMRPYLETVEDVANLVGKAMPWP
jgi:hypothetical protein